MIDPQAKSGLTPDRFTRWLWFLVLAPPLAWAMHLLIGYSLHASACEQSSRALLWAVSLLILIPLFTGWRAFVLWQSWPDPYAGGGAGKPEDEESRLRSRERFLALSGFGMSCFMILLILGQSVHLFVLRPCD
jgi:hypothetical protein